MIHIINLKKRVDRRAEVTKQMEMEKCSYMFWNGILGKTPKENVAAAHKQIIQHAKDNGLPEICVAEDDLQWTGSGAWKYFLENKPTDFDVYVGSYYSGKHDEKFIVKGFRGLTIYICAAKYYDTFLSLSESIHIDSAIDLSGAKIVVSPKFVATQSPGFSDQRRRFANDSSKMVGKDLYK